MMQRIPWYESIFIERFAPLILSVASLLAVFFLRSDIAIHFASNDWKSSDLYTAVFGWASIQTGFVFGIYGFVASKTDGFIKVVSEDRSFQRFTRYIKRANLAGFLLTFFTLPMIVGSPELKDPNSVAFFVTTAWFAVFVWTFCAFLRVAFIFGKVVAVPDRPRVIPG
jgi:hypothetical protein